MAGGLPSSHSGGSSNYKPAWNPPAGGGPGTQPVNTSRRTVKTTSEGGVTGIKLTAKQQQYGKGHNVHYSTTEQQPDAKIISNYQRQIFELESAKTELQKANLRTDYQRSEASHAARERELEAANDKLRKEALAAGLRLQTAMEREAEAKEHLTEQREKFSAARQELTAEVVAYQRDLDELAHQKRQLQADLQDSHVELREVHESFRSFDSEKRLLMSQAELKSTELERALARESLLRVELGEERVQFASLKEKYDALKSRQAQVDDATSSHLHTAAEASAGLRKAKIELEAEQAARKHAEATNEFLVLEAAHLDAAMKELTSNAEFIAQENARLRQETGNNKVMKAVGRFMIRKMREKLTEAQASEKNMRDNQLELNSKYVKAEQKASAIERELMVMRRRQAEREAAYEQQRVDASDLSVENRMLLEKTEQLVVDGERTAAKVKGLETSNVESRAELDVMKERLEVTRALLRFRPEDLAGISRINTELAQSIQFILPKLGGSAEGQPASSSSSSAALAASSEPQLQSLGMAQ